MYEELVNKLKTCANINSLSLYKRQLMKEAANAIESMEELVENAYSMIENMVKGDAE